MRILSTRPAATRTRTDRPPYAHWRPCRHAMHEHTADTRVHVCDCPCAAVRGGAVPGLAIPWDPMGFQAELLARCSGVAVGYELPACMHAPETRHTSCRAGCTRVCMYVCTCGWGVRVPLNGNGPVSASNFRGNPRSRLCRPWDFRTIRLHSKFL